MKKPVRLSLMLCAAAIGVAGIGYAIEGGPAAPAHAEVMPGDVAVGYGGAGMAEAASLADRSVGSMRNRLAAGDAGWLHKEALALALMDRFGLSGDISDANEAAELLDSGLADAPDGSGPTLTRAALAMSFHDLDTAERMLDRFAIAAPRRTQHDRAVALALRGDIAMQRGELGRAQQLYAQAAQMNPALGSGMRVADRALWAGEPAEAARLSGKTLAAQRPEPWHFAKAALHRANIAYASGELDTAGRWIAAADDAFPGYWVAQTYAAQQRAATGAWDEGIADLERIARESGEPEVMDVLAGFLAHRGRTPEAARWSEQARVAWLGKLGEARDAYRLHAAEHFLDFGDASKALELAREEYGMRRSGEVAEVYASALTENGRPQDALKVLAAASKAGWRSVSLDLAYADAHRALGDDDAAARWEDRALELSPLALDPRRKLLRFGHY